VKLFCVVVLAVFLSGAGAGGSAAQEKFRVASGGFSTAVHAVVWAAYEKKIFQKYGLEGEYLALESGTPAMQALLQMNCRSSLPPAPWQSRQVFKARIRR
jgi:ABC-type nitrate/sulfonate/bicarbonate transport system substrate-binding protein